MSAILANALAERLLDGKGVDDGPHRNAGGKIVARLLGDSTPLVTAMRDCVVRCKAGHPSGPFEGVDKAEVTCRLRAW